MGRKRGNLYLVLRIGSVTGTMVIKSMTLVILHIVGEADGEVTRTNGGVIPK